MGTLQEVTDAELVRRTQTGERAAFALLIERHRGAALRAARCAVSLRGGDEAAREAVQEATLRAYLSLDNLREPERFGSWLCGIARNVCRERLPLVFPWEAAMVEPLLPTSPDAAAIVEARAEARQVREAVALLSPALREVTQRHYFEGWTLPEIAAQLGINLSAAKVRLYEARKRLRPLLQEFSLATPALSPVTRSRRRAMYIPVRIVSLPGVREITTLTVDSPESARDFLILAARGVTLASPQIPLLTESGDNFVMVTPESTDMTAALISPTPRGIPLLNLTRQIMEAAGVSIEAIRLESLDGDTPVATLTVRTSAGIVPVEASPTEALAFALNNEVPCTIAAPLLEREAWHIPDPEALVQRIVAGDADNPFVVRLAENLLIQAARWGQDSRLEIRLEIRQGRVFTWAKRFNSDGSEMPGRTNEFPIHLPAPVLPTLITHLCNRAEMASDTSEFQESILTTEFTILKHRLTYRISVSIGTGENGEYIGLRNLGRVSLEPTEVPQSVGDKDTPATG